MCNTCFHLIIFTVGGGLLAGSERAYEASWLEFRALCRCAHRRARGPNGAGALRPARAFIGQGDQGELTATIFPSFAISKISSTSFGNFGLHNKYPCPSSQLYLRRKWNCSVVSMPSPTTRMPRSCERAINDFTIEALSALVPISRTNEPSILMLSGESRRK